MQLNSMAFPKPRDASLFPMGLNYLDMDNSGSINIKAWSDVTTTPSDTVTVHLDAGGDAVLYGAGCSWLDISENNSDFQCGQWSTLEDHPAHRPQTMASTRIKFPNAYSATPQVVVWLNQFEILTNRGRRVKAFATDITATEFTLHIDTWADTILYSGTAWWIAYPSDSKNIVSGTYMTDELRHWTHSQQLHKKAISFPQAFESVPRVVSAFYYLDVSYVANFRVKTTLEDISTTGLTWNIDSWGDTEFSSAKASYIAFV